MIWFLAFLSVLFGVDFLSKAYIYHHFPLNGGFSVFTDFLGIDFSINYAANTGAAWGVFAGYPNALLYFRIGIIGTLLWYILKQKKLLYPLLLILTGAIGNVLDYFLYGHVVDMFYFKFGKFSYPVFNVADSAIFCGTVWLILISKKKNEKCSA